MTRTRFAPTISGELHLGSLYNALLNWAYARRNSGEFFIRFDGVRSSKQREEWAESILRDLELFGLEPDGIVWQKDRRDMYMSALTELLDTQSVYVCMCREGDIFERITNNHSEFRILHREEKYPGECMIKTLVPMRAKEVSEYLIPKCAYASGSSFDTSPEAVLNFDNDGWRPRDAGCLRKGLDWIVVELADEEWISGIRIDWGLMPVRSFVVRVDSKLVARYQQQAAYWNYHRPSGPYEGSGESPTQIMFQPVKGKEVKVEILETLKYIKREYFYDGYCRDKNHRFDQSKTRTVVRAVADSYAPLDVAIYYDKQPNLVFNSAYDELSMQITDVIRGFDIKEFSWMETTPAKLVGYRAKQFFHSMIVDENCVKLSKFVESPPARNYVRKGDPLQVINFLCTKAGVIESPVNNILELPSAIDFSKAFVSSGVVRVGKVLE